MTPTRNITFALLGLSLASFSANSQAEWKYQITPYLWASSLDGTTAVAGQEVDFSADFSDLVSNLDASFMLFLISVNSMVIAISAMTTPCLEDLHALEISVWL